MRKQITTFNAFYLIVFLLLFTPCLTAMAQEQEGEEEATAQEASEVKAEVVEKIKKEQEEVDAGGYFSYNPEGRRDPFVSVIEDFWYKKKGPRPKGIAGMLISEIDLVGIAKDPAGDIAFFHGSDNKGYFLRAGDEVYDGKLLKIDKISGAATFRQQMDDPRLIKPFRDVIKRLRPLEEDTK
jgi:hypothetical protein